MMFASTVFVATLACWGIIYLDLLPGFHGASGIIQTIGLSVASILASGIVYFFGRGVKRALSGIL